MTDYTHLFAAIEKICDTVHDEWMGAQLADGRKSAPSRHEDGSPELMVPYSHLLWVDQADDWRVSFVVACAIADLPAEEGQALLAALRDPAFRAQLRSVFESADPVPPALVERCRALAAGEDGQR